MFFNEVRGLNCLSFENPRPSLSDSIVIPSNCAGTNANKTSLDSQPLRHLSLKVKAGDQGQIQVHEEIILNS